MITLCSIYDSIQRFQITNRTKHELYKVQIIELVLFSNLCIKPYNYAFPYRCFKVTNIMLSIHSTGTTPLGKTKDFSIRTIKCNTNLSKC